MRKIVSQHKQKSKDRFNQIAVGLVLVFLMMLSIVGYSLGGRDTGGDERESITYNGFNFVQSGGYWSIIIENFQFIFRYNPNEVNKSNSTLNYVDSYFNKPLYLESESNEASTEIYLNLDQIAQRMQPACQNTSNCTGDFPIKDCNSNFIIIKESNTTSIEQDKGCVFISAPEDQLVATTDEFLFKILGIENNPE